MMMMMLLTMTVTMMMMMMLREGMVMCKGEPAGAANSPAAAHTG